jgi:hypothetical protein
VYNRFVTINIVSLASWFHSGHASPQFFLHMLLLPQFGVKCLYSSCYRAWPKRDKVTGGWRKLHNEEFHDLYSSPSIITIIKSRRMRWARHVARMGKMRNAYRLLVGKPEGKSVRYQPIPCVHTSFLPMLECTLSTHSLCTLEFPADARVYVINPFPVYTRVSCRCSSVRY